MTKQEFLAMSLPYELHGITANRIALINGVEYEKELPIIWRGEKFSGRCGLRIMPILHPLSDLTKEIEHKGEKFVPVIKLASYPEMELIKLGYEHKNYYAAFGYKGEIIRFYIPLNVNDMNLYTAQKLIEWHFDLGGLIEKNEAVDVNKLQENPYK